MNKGHLTMAEINALVEARDYISAITALDELINREPSAELYFERGKLCWKLGRRKDAISDYERAVSMDAESPAGQALEMSRNIMNFFNKDLYNP